MTEELQAPDPDVGELDAAEPVENGELLAQPDAEVGERSDLDAEAARLDPNFDNLPADQLSPEEVRIRAYYKKAMEEQALKYREEQERIVSESQAGSRSGQAVDNDQLQRDLQTLLAFDAARNGTTEFASMSVENEKLDPLADDYEQRLEARMQRRIAEAVSKERDGIMQQLQALQQKELRREWDAFRSSHKDAESLKGRMAEYMTQYNLDFQKAYDLARVDAARAAKRDAVVMPAPLGTPPRQDSVSGNAPSDKTVAVDLSGLSPYQQLLKQAEMDPTGELAASLKVLREERQ